ncbi:MAG: Clp protease ClpP [Clostridia bacterium]|nr:Clp protease ClpP [Clostridia bacterium]
MREISLNGYIDEEVWYGDEITPESLHEALYGADGQFADDVHIRLNSYGGSCNAATRMFDDIRAYPGNVIITISGTAASAATVLSMAADRVEMTPGSLFMIHDPSTVAWGSERDLLESIQLLRACKESILNCYATRCRKERGVVADMMTATTWMDVATARENGFVDAVTESAGGPTNAEGERIVSRKDAEAKVRAWFDRHRPRMQRSDIAGNETSPAPDAAAETVPITISQSTGKSAGTPVAQLRRRLELIQPKDR